MWPIKRNAFDNTGCTARRVVASINQRDPCREKKFRANRIRAVVLTRWTGGEDVRVRKLQIVGGEKAFKRFSE